VDGISFTFFNARDVVRHALVARIVHAYEAFEDPNSAADESIQKGSRRTKASGGDR
jgi:phosphate starvation-inducible PhoH-like protein